MTFDEALARKSEYSEPVETVDEDEFELLVMPESEEDFVVYDLSLTKDNVEDIDDGWARRFSSNGRYVLGGIAFEHLASRGFLVRHVVIKDYKRNEFNRFDLTTVCHSAM